MKGLKQQAIDHVYCHRLRRMPVMPELASSSSALAFIFQRNNMFLFRPRVIISPLCNQRWGHVGLSVSAQRCLWRSVSLCVPFMSDLRVTVLLKGCMCSLVNQVYTSFSLASLRSLLPVTSLTKDDISELVK